MKRLFLAVTVLCTGIIYGQQEKNIFIEQGRWGLGGQFSLSYTEYENRNYDSDIESFQIVVMPEIGYSIADNWLLGLNFMYGYNSRNTNSSTFSNEEILLHSIGVAPFIQRYFPVVDKFAFNLRGSLDYEHRWREETSYSIPVIFKESSFAIAIRPGFSYLLGEHFALVATTGILSYSTYNNEEAGKKLNEGKNFQMDFGLSNLHFGAIYYF